MCGIAGFSLTPADNEMIDSSLLASVLLTGIEERGRHATGAAWHHDDGQVWLTKMPVPATQFVIEFDHVPAESATAILHTRWATKGDTSRPENNHPIDTGGIVGIHNGVMHNDDELFSFIGDDKRIAEVDSEAIFALLAYSGLATTEALGMLEGSAAVAWYDVTDPQLLHLSRVSASPLVLGRTVGGSFIFASSAAAIRKAAKAVEVTLARTFDVAEGTYFTIRDGRLTNVEHFDTDLRALTVTEKRALNLV